MIHSLPPAVTRHATPLQAVADRKLLALANAVLITLTRLRFTFSLRAAAQTVRDHHGVENLPDWSMLGGLSKAVAVPIEPILYDLVLAGAKTESDYAALFHLINPRAVLAAQRQVADLVVGITEEGIAALRGILSASLAGGYTPAESARLIRDVVGLDSRRASAVVSYRASLEGIANGTSPLSDAYRALADGRYSPATGLSGAKIDTMVSRYADRQLADRSMTIARTETMRAAQLGRAEIWDEAAATGLIDRATAQIVWVITDEACDECLENESVSPIGFDDSWPNGDPPVHPNCRCDVSLET